MMAISQDGLSPQGGLANGRANGRLMINSA